MFQKTPTQSVLLKRSLTRFGLGLFAALIIGVFVSLVPASKTSAAATTTVNFQARLETSAGAIVPDGNYNVEFKLYNTSAPGGGHTEDQGACTYNGGTTDSNCLWVETRTGGNQVQVVNGYLSVALGSVNSFPSTINWNQNLWLSMRIGGTGAPSWDTEMSPRLALTATPYSFQANQLANYVSGNQELLQFTGSPSGAVTIDLPDTSGTLCLQGSASCGFVSTGGLSSSAFVQGGNSFGTATLLGTNDSNSLSFETNGSTQASIAVGGATLFKNSIDSTTAFQIQSHASGTSILDVDTTHGEVGINTNSPGYALDVNGVINSNTSIDVGGVAVCTVGGCTAASSSGYYIQNATSIQSPGNFAIRSTGTGSVTGVLQGASGQTADILDVQSWNGTSATTLLGVGANGRVGIGTSSTPSALLSVGGTTGNFTVNTSGDVATSGTVSTSVGGAAGVGTQQLASDLYIQSRGTNLITNGTGLLGNNYNFSSFTFDNADVYSGKGSFENSTYSAAVYNDELLPVDPTSTYQLDLWAEATTYVSGAHAYFGVAPYDIDGNSIQPYMYGKYAGSTDTTLAANLNPGDSTVQLTNASGWYNSTQSGVYSEFTWYGYTNAEGYTYPNYTYSRYNTYNTAGYTSGAWTAGGISGNTITLASPWSGPALTAGTAVRNSQSGGTYKYIAASDVNVPSTWTEYSGRIGGFDVNGTLGTNLFPYGTAYVRLLFLMNRDVAGNTTNVSDLSFVNNSGVFNAATVGTVPLVAQGANGQTADLLDIQSYNGVSATTLSSFNSSGNLSVNGTTLTSSALTFGASGTATVESASGQNLNVYAQGATTLALDSSSSGGTVDVGNANATTVKIGSSGSTALASAVTIATSSSSSSIQAVTIGSNGDTSNTITIDAGTGANSIAIGNSASAHNIAIGNGSGANNVTINIGTGVTGTSNSAAVTIGSANADTSSITTIQGGSNTTDAVLLQTATGGVIQIGSQTASTSNTVNIGDSGSTTNTDNVNIDVTSGTNTSTITLGGTGSASGTITIGQATTATTTGVNILSGNGTASTQTVTIAGGTSTTSGGKVVDIATGAAGSGTTNTVHIADTSPTGTGTNAVTIGSATAAANTLLLQGGNGTGASAAIKIQPNVAGDVLIGASAETGTVTLGSSSATNTEVIAGGSGATTLQIANVQNGGSVSVGAGLTTGTVSIGGTSTTGTIKVGQYNGSSTSIVDIADNAGSSSTQQINIGASGSGINTVTIGSGSSSSATTINAGTGNLLLQTGTGSGTTGSINIQSGNSSGGASGNITIDAGTNVPSGSVVEDKTFESGTNDMIDWFDETSAQSSAKAHSGTHSLAVTVAAGGPWYWGIEEHFNGDALVTPGHSYNFSAWFLAGSAGESIQLNAAFLNASNGTVENDIVGSATDNSSTWTEIQGTFTAPASSYQVVFYITSNSAEASGDVHYIDDIETLDTSTTTSPSINIGTANAQEVSIGNVNQSAATTILGGGGINIGTGAESGAIQIGSTSAAVFQAIGIGNNATSGSTTNITVGNTQAGTITLQGQGLTQTITGTNDTFAVNDSTTNSPPVQINQSGTGDASLQMEVGGDTFIQGVSGSSGNFEIASSSSSNPGTFGYSSIGPSLDTYSAGNAFCSEFSPASTGTVTSMSIYVENVGPSPYNEYTLAIYSNSSSDPGSLIANSGVATLTNNAWNTLSISASVTSGTNYWLCYNNNGNAYNQDQPAYNTGGSGAYSSTGGISVSSWPSTYPSPSNTTDKLSIYATYSPTGSYNSFNTALFQLTATGQALFQNYTNSATAFQVQNSSGSNVVQVDTTSNTVSVGVSGSGGVFVNNGATLNTAKNLGNFGSSGSMGSAASTVDIYSTFVIPQTTGSVTLTIQNPTNTTAGRVIYILNTGSATLNFTNGSISLPAGDNTSLLWNGSSWTSTAVSTGVSIIGALDGGSANSTGATISGNTLYLQSASATNPGLVNNTTQSFSGNKTFTATVAGSTALTVKGASGQTGDLLDLQNNSGANLQSFDASGDQETLGNIDTPEGGLGQYGNMLTNSETIGGTGWTIQAGEGVTANATSAPNGQTTAYQLASTSGGGVYQTFTTNSTTSPYTFSFWAKAGTSSAIAYGMYDSTSSTYIGGQQFVNLTTTWQRFTVTGTASGTGHTIEANIYANQGGAGGFTNFVWGAQVVQASTAGVYTTTVGSTVAASYGSSIDGTLLLSGNATVNGTYNTNTFNSSTLTFGASGTATIDSATGQTLQVGTGANAHNITVGNATSSSVLLLQAGTGGLNLQSQGGSGINIGTNGVAQAITIGNTTGATAITINGGTGAIQIGTQAIADTITIGNTTGASSVNIQGGTGNIYLGNQGVADSIYVGNNTGGTTVTVTSGTGGIFLNSTSTGSINLATGSSNGNINLTTDNSGSSIVAKTTANSTTAFQVQNASSAVVLNVNTSNQSVSVTGLASPGTTTLLLAPVIGSITLHGSGNSLTDTYVVTAVNSNGEVATLSSASASNTNSPTTLNGTNYNTVNWTASGGTNLGTVTYYVYRTVASSGYTTGLIGTTTSTSFNDQGQTPSQAAPAADSTGTLTDSPTTYYYEITALDSAGNETTPNAQTSVTLSANKSIDLSWAPIAGARAYNVYRSTTMSVFTNTLVTTVYTNSYLDKGASTSSVSPPTTTSAAANVISNNAASQLTVGSNGTATGQLYVGGQLPNLISSLAISNGVTADYPAVQGNYMYLATGANLQIFDISVPANPTFISSTVLTSGFNGQEVALGGTYAYVMERNSSSGVGNLDVFNISNPSSPNLVGHLNTTGSSITADANSIAVEGNYAYIINGSSNTIEIINVANPASPAQVTTYSSVNSANGIAVQGNYAYSISSSSDLVVENISNPASPSQVADAKFGTNLTSIAVQGRYAYIQDATNSLLRIIDISNPADPIQVGSLSTSNSTNDSIAVNGRYVYLGTSTTILTIDISNSANPVNLGAVNTVGGVTGKFAVQGRYLYSSGSTAIGIYDLGGGYIQQLQVGGTETGTLEVDGSAVLNNGATVAGGLSVTQGAEISSSLSVNGSAIFTPSTALTCNLSNYTSTVTGNSPSAYWQLNDTGGSTASDSSGNSDTGTLQTGVTENYTPGPIGCGPTTPAMTFNGSTGYVSTTTSYVNPETFSLSAWFKTTSPGPIISFENTQTGTPANYDRAVYIDSNGHLVFGVYNATISNNVDAISNVPVTDGNWHFVTATYSSSSGVGYLYLDGNLIGSSYVSSAQSYTGYWRIGNFGSSGATTWPNLNGNVYFNGDIGQVSVIPSVLTASQVSQLASYGGVGGSSNNLQVQNSLGVPALDVNTNNQTVSVGGLATPGATSLLLAPVIGSTTQNSCSGSATYQYVVTAINSNGELQTLSSAASASQTCNTTLSSSNYLTVNWTASAGTNKGTVTYYVYRYATGGGATALTGLIGTTTSTSFNDKGQTASQTVPVAASTGSLSTSTTYSYEITAMDAAGNETTPNSQTSLATDTVSKSIDVSWAPVPGSRYYNVYNTTLGVYYTTRTNSLIDTGTYGTTGSPPSTTSAAANVISNNAASQLTVGSNGTATGQLYVGGQLPTSAFDFVSTPGASTANWPTVASNYMYIPAGNTLQIFDVTTPYPTFVSSTSISNTSLTAEAVVVQGKYAYVQERLGSGSGNLDIFDVSNPTSPTIVGSITTSGSAGATHSAIAIEGSYVYIQNGTSNNVQIINVSNPVSPTNVTTFSGVNFVQGIAVQGNYAYAISNTSDLVVENISNPASPSQVSDYKIGTNLVALAVSGRYAYVQDATNSLFDIIDISNPADPIQVGTVNTSSSTHSTVVVQGRYAYVGTSAGIQIIDISNPDDPITVGTINTFGANAFAVQGRYLYASGTGNMSVWDLGGAYIQQLQVGGTETGTLDVDGSATLNNGASVAGGLSVTQGIQVSGSTNINVASSTTAFEVSSSSAAVFTVDTTNSQVIVGSGSNEVTLSGSSGYTATGTARHTKKIVLVPEYAGAVLSSTGCSSDIGTMTAGYDGTQHENYYKWTTNQGSNQCYNVVVQIPIPSDFSSGGGSSPFGSTTPLTIDVNTSDTTNGTIVGTLLDTSGTAVTNWNTCTLTPTSGHTNTWVTSGAGGTNAPSACSIASGTWTAGGVATLTLQIQAPNAGTTNVGDIVLTYLSAF